MLPTDSTANEDELDYREYQDKLARARRALAKRILSPCVTCCRENYCQRKLMACERLRYWVNKGRCADEGTLSWAPSKELYRRLFSTELE